MELALDHPWLVALALVALPLVLGASLGAALRRWTRRPVPAGVALAAAALAGAWAALPWLPEVSPYDVLGVAATFAAALAVAARRPLERVPRAVLGASASVAVLGLAALELGARALPPPPMGMSPQARQALTVPLELRDFGLEAVFPDRYPPPWLPGMRDRGDWERPRSGRRVLHLGDSMVASGDVPPGEAFMDCLSRDTGDDHVNMGVSNSGTDLHLMVFRRWVGRASADAVVLHVFSGNDPEDIDRPYLYCDGGPLLGDFARGMPLRCPAPAWRVTRRNLLGYGPSPYALRVMATRSALARQGMWLFERLIQSGRRPHEPLPSGSPQWRRVGEIFRVLAAEAARANVPLTVSVLPYYRGVLNADRREQEETRALVTRLASLSRAAGIRTLDPLDDLRAAVQARPGARWFLPPSPHFDVDGHRWYATWLEGQMGWARP